MRLRLGTVQFGMDYGIKGQRQPSVENSLKLLDYATQNGIVNLDTASAYGTAEDVVGKFLSHHTINRYELNISSKLIPNLLDEVKPEDYEKKITELIKGQLKRLHTDYLDAYMYHSARYVYNEALLKALQTVKQQGLARKVGVSVYEPEEVKEGFQSQYVDFMQFPYSIFDQRMLKAGVFDMAEKSCTEIDTRSTFIQGLILMKENEVPEFLSKAKPVVKKIDEICKKHNFNRVELAISFVKIQKSISSLVLGVDNIEQLKQDIEFFNNGIDESTVKDIANEFIDIETDIVMPSLWKK